MEEDAKQETILRAAIVLLPENTLIIESLAP